MEGREEVGEKERGKGDGGCREREQGEEQHEHGEETVVQQLHAVTAHKMRRVWRKMRIGRKRGREEQQQQQRQEQYQRREYQQDEQEEHGGARASSVHPPKVGSIAGVDCRVGIAVS